MSSVATPPPEPPQPTSLPPGPRADLVENVRNALRALPFHFTSRTAIEGLEAGDLFSLNSVLGGTIEIQTVQNLNRLREVWDPNDQFPDYGFERFSQTFPDVRLVTRSESKPSPILGVELKGWYLLSREGEPSFRYTATREADYRNYYWRYQRGVKADGRIESPEDVQPYPPAKAITADKPKSDSGGNFGRVARVSGLMDWYTELRLSTRVAGIEARHWVSFFKTYADAAKADRVHERITTLLARESDRTADEQTRRIVELLEELRNLLA